jgi:hypothetical protein
MPYTLSYVENVIHTERTEIYISHHSHQGAEEGSVPLLHLPSSHDRGTSSTQNVFIATHVQYQKGKFEDNHSKHSAADDVIVTDEEMTDEEMMQEPVIEQIRTFSATCDGNQHRIAAEGIVPLQEENDPCSCTGIERSDYLDENSASDDSCTIG